MSDSIVTGNLEIKLVRSGTTLTLQWLGEADERDPAKVIRPFLDQIESLAFSANRQVTVDLSTLRFMNSSCIGIVTSFVRSLDERGVLVEVIYDTRQTWQVLSKRCTKTIFGRSERVTVVDRAEAT
jgi:anti-anti-sigma regulatory factor